MNFQRHLRGVDARVVVVGLMLVFGSLSQSVYGASRQEQQSSQSQQQASDPQKSPQPSDPPSPKTRKVWTNDDMPSLRSPADNYLAEKEAQDSAEALAAAKRLELARQAKEAGLTIKLPPTSEETQGLIKNKEEQIKDWTERLDRLKHDLPDAPADRKGDIQGQVEVLTVDLRKDQIELKVLQEHLDSFPKKPRSDPGESTSMLAPPPSPQNP